MAPKNRQLLHAIKPLLRAFWRDWMFLTMTWPQQTARGNYAQSWPEQGLLSDLMTQ